MTANLTVPATGTIEENRDTRLSAALEAVDKGQFDLVSFDCFDTLLYRKTPKPIDLFEILGQRLLDKGLMASHIPARAFAAQRIIAEDEARRAQFKKISSGEVLLRHIWQEMPAGMFPDHDYSDILQEELECENSLLRYDQNMLNLALFAQQKGLATAIVSDTYFEAAHMTRFLDRKSGSFTPDHLLLSSDYGTSKAAGLLAMLPRLSDIPPQRILHIGDAPHADVEPAKKIGIVSCYFPKETRYSKECLFREHDYGDLSRPADWFDPVHGDFGLASLRVKTAFDQETGRQEPGRENAAELSANTLAPLFSWFAVWIKERAAALGLDHVHCLMREGAYLSELIDHEQTLPPLATSTLWASRYALTRAGIYKGTPDEVKGFLDRPIMMTVEDMAKELGLEPEDVLFYRKKHGDYFLGDDTAREFLTGLYENESTRKRMVEMSARWRTNYINYLKQHMNLSGDKPAGLVDLGYSGTIQRSLNNILAGAGYTNVKTIGLYMLTTSRARDILAQGHYIEGFLTNLGGPERMIRSVYRSPEILEQICMPDQGSLLSIDDNGEPMLDDCRIDAAQFSEVTFMRKAIRGYQQNLGRQALADRLEDCPAISTDNPRLKNQLSRIVQELILFPQKTDLDVIGNWHHDENYASERTRKLVDIDSFEGRFEHTQVRTIAETPSHSCFWPVGVAAERDMRLAEVVRKVVLRESAISLSDGLISEGNATIHFDTGAGYGNCPSLNFDYKTNPFGRAWFRGSVTAGGAIPKALGIQFGHPGDIIRVDHLSLTGTRLNGDSFSYDLVALMDGQFPWLNATNLAPSLARIDDSPALISLTGLDDKLYGLEELHIEIRFTVMAPLQEETPS